MINFIRNVILIGIKQSILTNEELELAKNENLDKKF